MNGVVKQQGDLADMVWDVPHMLHFLSQYYELMPGDLVFTGTPAGVAAVVPGDVLVGRIEDMQHDLLLGDCNGPQNLDTKKVFP